MDGSTLQWTEEMLISIERMAGAAFSFEEMADVLEIEQAAFSLATREEGHPVQKRIRKGMLTRQLELRERIFKDAKNGSSPAQTLAVKLLDNMKIDYSGLL
jgi:hypothetical protein